MPLCSARIAHLAASANLAAVLDRKTDRWKPPFVHGPRQPDRIAGIGWVAERRPASRLMRFRSDIRIAEMRNGAVCDRPIWTSKAIDYAGLAPGVPHLANLPFASLQLTGLAGFFSAHLMNLPCASRQWVAAKLGVVAIVRTAAAKAIERSIVGLLLMFSGSMLHRFASIGK